MAVTADIISATEQGLIGDGLTLNIGTIEGGSAGNIVSDLCRCTGEVRGADHDEAERTVRELEERIATVCEAAGAGYTFGSRVMIRAYRTPEDDRSCETFIKACRSLGLEGRLVSTRGGSDNNVFAQNGIRGIVVASGMENTHTTSEYIRISDIECGCRLVAELIRLS